MDQPSEKVFAEGIYLNKVYDNAPDFIKANVSINVKSLISWLATNQKYADEKGFIKLVGKESKQGKRYFELDTWKPDNKEEAGQPPF